MELDAWVIQEQHVWRHLNTFGGYTWHREDRPLTVVPVNPPLSLDEALDEVEWLLDGGMWIGDVLKAVPGHTAPALERGARRRGRTRLAARIYEACPREFESGASRRKQQQQRRTA